MVKQAGEEVNIKYDRYRVIYEALVKSYADGEKEAKSEENTEEKSESKAE